MKQNLSPTDTSGCGDGLLSAGGAAAFELKFLIDDQRAAAVERWAGQHLARDIYSDSELAGAYRTTSLYCDTPQLDVYHGARWYRRRKFRIRQYGGADYIFLERKMRSGDRVSKRRTSLAAEQLSMLAGPIVDSIWPGYWFHRRVIGRRLGPTCQITYERSAYVGASRQEALRLTLDRQIRGILTDRWCLAPTAGGIPLLAGQVVLELKFQSALPTSFKQLVAALHLRPAKVSKYRLCHDTWRSNPLRVEAAGA